MPADLLFDLDGTLIDSSPGILATFERVLAAHGIRPAVPLAPALIGPPLAVTLAQVSGCNDESVLRRLAEAFKAVYDEEGYRATTLYPGVANALAQLASAGARLFVVTNKRLAPTCRILDFLDLTRHFAGIHARDECEPPAPSKAALARRVMLRHAIAAERAFFIGDSDEDAAAARENGLAFIHAAYGYGAAGLTAPAAAVLEDFARLPALVAALMRGRRARARP